MLQVEHPAHRTCLRIYNDQPARLTDEGNVSDRTKDELYADLQAAQEAYDSENRKATAEWHRAAAPARNERDQAVINAEAEYTAKVREAKGELASVSRRVTAQLADFRLTRDARIRAADRTMESLLSPLRVQKGKAVAHLKKMKDEAWQRWRDAPESP